MGVTVAQARPLLLPVTVNLDEGITSATASLGVAVIVLLPFSALCRGVSALGLVQVIRWSQVSAVTLFLIAQLNGLPDVAALVVLYALSAAASLFLLLDERSGAGRWPFAYGAAVGIILWGVVAFYQSGAIVAGYSPASIIRVMTITMLAVAAGYWIVASHHKRADLGHSVFVVAHVTLLPALLWLLFIGLCKTAATASSLTWYVDLAPTHRLPKICPGLRPNLG